ncbi:MAG TPA: class I SAM-dependent methyltransferase [Dehalococcoidia bacterium]|nr:class I SAM-dependent methyltransferase [Dehalococcoidia bacterium]
MLPETHCAACGAGGLLPFYELQEVPVSAGLLLPTRQEALDVPRGAIRLAFCRECGFIENVLFDEALLDYASMAVEPVVQSAEVRAKTQELAASLVRRWDLNGKGVLEIGCGEGEFLADLCRLGSNRGLGIDPASLDRRPLDEGAGKLRFLQARYNDDLAHLGFDFVACRHTLDRVAEAQEFVGLVRNAVGRRRDPVAFFEVADATRALRQVAFWDVRYECCSYFSAGSLARLFRNAGFEIFDLCASAVDGCLLIEAVAANGGEGPYWESEDDLAEIEALVTRFRAENQPRLWEWGSSLLRLREHGGRAVLWGMNEKTAAYMSVLGINEEVSCVIDPGATGSMGYVAGTGHEVLPVEALRERRPSAVVVSEKSQLPEARRELLRAGLRADLSAL